MASQSHSDDGASHAIIGVKMDAAARAVQQDYPQVDFQHMDYNDLLVFEIPADDYEAAVAVIAQVGSINDAVLVAAGTGGSSYRYIAFEYPSK